MSSSPQTHIDLKFFLISQIPIFIKLFVGPFVIVMFFSVLVKLLMLLVRLLVGVLQEIKSAITLAGDQCLMVRRIIDSLAQLVLVPPLAVFTLGKRWQVAWVGNK